MGTDELAVVLSALRSIRVVAEDVQLALRVVFGDSSTSAILDLERSPADLGVHLGSSASAYLGLECQRTRDEKSLERELDLGKLFFYRDKVRGLEHEFEPLAIDVWLKVPLDVKGMVELSDVEVAILQAVVPVEVLDLVTAAGEPCELFGGTW